MASKSLPLVSAIIPCRNAERFLAEAIRSVLDQDSGPVEVVVVDDGSTDCSVEVARSFGGRVRVCQQPHAGAATARNRGIELARGAWIAFLDADDVWPPGRLSRMTAALGADPSVGMVLGRTEQFVSPEISSADRDTLRFDDAPRAARTAGAVLIRRSELERVGVFSTEWETGEVIDWFNRAAEAGVTSVMLTDVVLRRRLHPQNHGVVRRDASRDYLRVIKTALDRRRAASSPARP